MKANSVKNLKIRKYYYEQELLKKRDRFIRRQLLNTPKILNNKRYLYLILNLLSRKNSEKFSKSALKSQCILTGRNKSINKHYSISRILLRNLLRIGIVPGYKKSAW